MKTMTNAELDLAILNAEDLMDRTAYGPVREAYAAQVQYERLIVEKYERETRNMNDF